MATYVELKGYKHGEIGNGRKKTCQNGTSTLDEIAKELNILKRSLQRALRIERNLTDSMKELLDTSLKQNTDHQTKLPMCTAQTSIGSFVCAFFP